MISILTIRPWLSAFIESLAIPQDEFARQWLYSLIANEIRPDLSVRNQDWFTRTLADHYRI